MVSDACAEGLEVDTAAVLAGVVEPKGFDTVATGEIPPDELAPLAVGAVAADTPDGLATAATGIDAVVSAGGVTVAESTLAVTFGDPAELVLALEVEPVPALDPVGALPIAAGFVFAATVGPVETAGPPGLLAGLTRDPFPLLPVDPMLTVIEDGGFATEAALAEGVVFTTSGAAFPCAVLNCEVWDLSALLVVPVTFCAAGTVPAPGVPIPGNTVPCCRLPSLGWDAGGVDIGAVLAVTGTLFPGLLSGKLIAGSFGGTGIAACAVVAAPVGGGCCG